MQFKIFPCGADKIPLIRGWQTAATDNPDQIRLWSDLFRERIASWGIPTGSANDIMVLDVDVKGDNGFETLKGLQLPATMSQKTPSGGAHYIYRLPKDGKRYGNKVKFLPGLDIRSEGGYICYYGSDNTPIVDAPSWLLEEKTEPTVPTASGDIIKISPEIAEGIISGSLDAIRDASPGESNNVLNTESFRIGQLVASGSVTREYAESALFRAAKERGKPDHEARATIRSGLNGGALKPLTSPFGAPVVSIDIPTVPQTEKWTPPYFTATDLLNTSKLKQPQLFRDWSTEDIHITTADGGTGKTTLKLYEAICLALGVPFLGFPCVQAGKTLLITGEDSREKLGAIMGQILKQMGIMEDKEKLEIVLNSVVIKKDDEMCLIVKDKQGFLYPNPVAMAKVMEAVNEIKPKMIVLDPISSFWGSESAVNDMGKAVIKFVGKLAQESRACVEMINHMGKQSANTNDMSQFAGRGGTGIPSHARVSRVLKGIDAEKYTELTGATLNDNQSAIRCAVVKFTDGSPLLNKEFLIIREGYLFHRQGLDEKKIREEKQKESDTERVFDYVKDVRSQDVYPTKALIVAHFMSLSDKMSEARVKNALNLLTFIGHKDRKLKGVVHPDATVKDEGFVIVKLDGTEI